MNDGGVCRTAPATPGLLNTDDRVIVEVEVKVNFEHGDLYVLFLKLKYAIGILRSWKENPEKRFSEIEQDIYGEIQRVSQPFFLPRIARTARIAGI